ncbi:MAG: flagellar assembly protein FliX [Gemmatimonas sp.]
MKITDTRAVGTTAPRRSGRSETANGDFARALSGEPAAQASKLSMAAPMTGVDALLSLQEVNGDERRGATRRHAEDLLGELDELRHGLLMGALSRAQLARLKTLVTARRARATDPRLADILDEIELRAAVELAKYEERN